MKKFAKIKVFSIFLAMYLCAVGFNIGILADGCVEQIFPSEVLLNQPYSSLLEVPLDNFSSKVISTLKEFDAFLPQCHETFYDKEKFNFDSDYFKDNSLIVLSTKGSSSIEYRVVTVRNDTSDKDLLIIDINKFTTELMKNDCVDYTILIRFEKEEFQNASKLKLNVSETKYTLPMLEGTEIKYDLVTLDYRYNLFNEGVDRTAAALFSSQQELSALKQEGDMSFLLPYNSDFFKTKSIIIFSYFASSRAYLSRPAELILKDNNKLLLNYNQTIPRPGFDYLMLTDYTTFILEIDKNDLLKLCPACPLELQNVDVIDDNALKDNYKPAASKTIYPVYSDALPNNHEIEGMSFAEYLDSYKNFSGKTISMSCFDRNSQPITDLDKLVFTGAMILILNDEDELIFTKTIIVDGDADGDGIVSATDARIALRVSAELEKLSLPALYSITSFNSSFDARQARKLLRYSAGLEIDFWGRGFEIR